MFGFKSAARIAEEELTVRQMIFQKILYEDNQRLQFTPDYIKLSQQKSVLVFIHDDMAQLQPNHDLVRVGSLSGFYPLGYGYTSKKFTFVKKELGLKSFPVALSLKDKENLPMFMADEYRIRGEIYAIRPQALIALDTHRQNGVQFKRVEVNINIGYQKLWEHHHFDSAGIKKYTTHLDKEEMLTQPMQMYIGREEYWMDQLMAGFFDFKSIDIIQEDRLWLKEYYQYSRVR